MKKIALVALVIASLSVSAQKPGLVDKSTTTLPGSKTFVGRPAYTLTIDSAHISFIFQALQAAKTSSQWTQSPYMSMAEYSARTKLIDSICNDMSEWFLKNYPPKKADTTGGKR